MLAPLATSKIMGNLTTKSMIIFWKFTALLKNTDLNYLTFSGEWYFDCNCQRCQDPTELETFVSALICEVCEEDLLLPTGDFVFDLQQK